MKLKGLMPNFDNPTAAASELLGNLLKQQLGNQNQNPSQQQCSRRVRPTRSNSFRICLGLSRHGSRRGEVKYGGAGDLVALPRVGQASGLSFGSRLSRRAAENGA
jgi:hypothetical protein